jgi:esterase/lipase superfamily enzyme
MPRNVWFVPRAAALPALALVTLLAACDSGEVARPMMPAPIIMKDVRLDFTRRVAPEDRQTNNVPVLFATPRAPAPEEAPKPFLTRAESAVRLGVTHVELGEPGWSFADLVESDRTSTLDTPRPVRVAGIKAFGELGGTGEQAFIDAIDRQVRRSPTGEAVIYVPGYRVTFNQVMALMGAWAHYLGRASPVIAFSWPTGTQWWSYAFDCPRARAHIPDIARLIALVAERSQAKRLSLLGFSCGAPLLAEALVQLRARHPEEDHAALQRRYRIANAIFVAADIDLTTFTRAHLPALNELARRTEVYISEDDVALKVSGWLARASRLGRPRLEELTREDLETLASNTRLVGVDVAGVPGAHEMWGIRGHGYWIANEWVSTDVLLSMIYPFDPAWRGLVHQPGPGMWTFPDDYAQRVGAAVAEAAPALRREGH